MLKSSLSSDITAAKKSGLGPAVITTSDLKGRGGDRSPPRQNHLGINRTQTYTAAKRKILQTALEDKRSKMNSELMGRK